MWHAIVAFCTSVAPPFMVLYALGVLVALGLLAASGLWRARWPRVLGWPLLFGLFVGICALLAHFGG